MGRVGLQFLAQIADMRVDSPFIAFKAIAALYFIHELHAAEYPIRCRGQNQQEIEFRRRQGNGLLSPQDGKFFLVDSQVPYGIRRRLLQYFTTGPPQQAVDAGNDFLDVERLGHIIVAAHVEADQAVRFIILGRQKNDGYIAELADAAADFEAIHAGHHQIEEHDLRLLGAQCM